MDKLFNNNAESIKWASFAQMSRQILQFITTILLTRLLFPSDFGLLNLILIFSGFVNIISDLGTSAFIIHKSTKDFRVYNTVFWINIFFSLIITVLIYVSSDFISNYIFCTPKLTSILRLFSICFIVSSLYIVPKSILEQHMNFDKLALSEFFSTLLSSVVVIYLALSNYGVYSLVIQNIFLNIFLLLFYLFYSRWRPKFIIDLLTVRELMKFSGGLLGFNVINYFARNFDNFIVGRILGVTALGYYSLAYRLLMYPLQNISSVISRVLLPSMSAMKHDIKTVKKIYMETISVVIFISFPVIWGMGGIINEFVNVVMGSKWLPIINIFYIFMPIALFQSIDSTTGVIYQSLGKTRLLFYWGAVCTAITVLGFIIGVKFGIYGVAISYLIVTLLTTYPSLKIPFRLIDLKLSEIVFVSKSSFIISMVIFVCMIILNKGVLISQYTLFIKVLISVIFYFLLSYKYNSEVFARFRGIIANSKKR